MAIIRSDHSEHQHIYGAISRDGNMMWGEGFQSKKIKEGTYVIEFEKPFAKLPSPVCTVFGPEWQTFNLSVAIVDVTEKYFICVTSSPNMPIDCGFTFIVFGDL